MDRINKAIGRGHMRHAFHLQRIYLKSYSAKLVAASEVNNERPVRERASYATVTKIAGRVDVWQECHEPVRVTMRSKGNGKFRPTNSFGFENRARQELLVKAMKPFLRLHPGQYAIQGGGSPAACDAVTLALQDGYRWVARLDVAECFPSLDPRRAAHLIPAPRRTIETTMVSDGPNTHRDCATNACEASTDEGQTRRTSGRASDTTDTPSGNAPDHASKRARQDTRRAMVGPLCYKISQSTEGLGSRTAGRTGIPQGSPISNLVAEALMAPVLAALPSGTVVVAHVDDIVVLTRTKREAAAHLMTLRRALAAHPAGPLLPKYAEVRRAADGFEFLGHHFRTRYGRLHVQPKDSKRIPFLCTIMMMLRLATAYPDRVDLPRLRRSVRSWFAQYPLWEDGPKFEWFALQRIAEIELAAHQASSTIKPVAQPQPITIPIRPTKARLPRPPQPPYRGPRLVIPDGPLLMTSRPDEWTSPFDTLLARVA
jgi:hypothetical protein